MHLMSVACGMTIICTRVVGTVCWMALRSHHKLYVWCHVRGWGRTWICCFVCCSHFCVFVHHLVSRCVIAVGHARIFCGSEDSQQKLDHGGGLGDRSGMDCGCSQKIPHRCEGVAMDMAL